MEDRGKVDWKSFNWKSRRDRCAREVRGISAEIIRLKGHLHEYQMGVDWKFSRWGIRMLRMGSIVGCRLEG